MKVFLALKTYASKAEPGTAAAAAAAAAAADNISNKKSLNVSYD